MRHLCRWRPGLSWWNGAHFQTKDDGSIDRSETLFTSGLCLASRGASEHSVAVAVADRDRALGYGKYSGRGDGGGVEYRRIAAKAVAITGGQRATSFEVLTAGAEESAAVSQINVRRLLHA